MNKETEKAVQNAFVSFGRKIVPLVVSLIGGILGAFFGGGNFDGATAGVALGLAAHNIIS